MKVIIAGSRNLGETKDHWEVLLEAIKASGFDITEVVSGGAEGVDSMGEYYATSNSIKLKVFPAEWKKLGRKAGMCRNHVMADYGDALIAVWDGQSKGTAHMIERARRKGLEVYVQGIF
jgi:hypothetical protein